MKIRLEDIEEVEDLPSQERIIRTPKEERKLPKQRVKTNRHRNDEARSLKEYKER